VQVRADKIAFNVADIATSTATSTAIATTTAAAD